MKKILIPFLVLLAVVLSIAATRVPFYANAPTLLQYGSVVMTADGSVTQSFTTSFGSQPSVVMIQQNNAAVSTTNFVTPTTSNAIFRSSIAGATSIWFAVGSP